MKDTEAESTFDRAARPLINWLAVNKHPHCKVIVDSTTAELVEGLRTFNTKDYLRD